MSSATKTCPISRAEFRQFAQAVEVKIADSATLAEVKEFATGSMGWHVNGKLPIKINGKLVQVQVGLILTIPYSKELPAD